MICSIMIGNHTKTGIQPVRLEEAPALPGDPTGHRNVYAITSDLWAERCLQTHLSFLTPPPGGRLLYEHDHQKVREAKEAWQRQHRSSIAGYQEDQDTVLAWLIWLEWWIGWALRSCSNPSIVLTEITLEQTEDLPTVLRALVAECERYRYSLYLEQDLRMADMALQAGNEPQMFRALKLLAWALSIEGVHESLVPSLPKAKQILAMGES